ncbi:MAG TPA: DUF4244 domain-containing protein [Acidimicrobiales bacterium]|nr:DUF4244 domain-containing protein [Acidimicrobiales bacterium]
MTTDALLGLQIRLLLHALGARSGARRPNPEAGQATAEYALVLLGAAAIALLVVSWATKTNLVGRLLDVVFGQLTSKTKP